MAADQRNFGLFTYVDNNAVSWNKRGEAEATRQAVDGSAAFGTHPNWGRETSRHSVRKIIYQDPTTFRTKSVIFYTNTAWTAVNLGTDTISFNIEGEATAVAYTAIKRVGERQPAAAAPRQLAKHA